MKVLSLLVIFLSSWLALVPSVEAKTYYNGPKGGCYYLSSSGKKVYVSHQYCSRDDEGTDGVYNPRTKKTYYTGPKGGCFYYGASYKKNYVDHAYCNR